MNLLDAYLENYALIAKDHVDHWRKTGQNPFQDPETVKTNETATFGLVNRYLMEPILDAGCGMGDLLARFQGLEVEGVDIAQEYLDIAYRRGLTVWNAQIEDLPFPNGRFGMVVAADVLEHVIDLHMATAELIRVLRPGGVIVTRVPNLDTVSCDPMYGYEFTHVRVLDEGTMCVLLSRIFGCEILESYIQGNVVHTAARKPR